MGLARGCVVGVLSLLALAPVARAGGGGASSVDASRDRGGDATEAPPPAWSGARSAEAGMFLPLTLSPRAGTQKAVVSVVSGWDSQRGAVLRASTEIHPWGPFVLQAGAIYAGATSLQPRLGVRVQILRQARHAVDVAIGAQYDGASYEGKPGFETFVAVSRQLGRVGLFANFVYGQELDETQRHGEVRLAALVRLAAPVYAGLDGRVAFDLDPGRTADAGEVSDVDFTATAGPTVSYSVRWFTLLLQGGGVATRWKGRATELGGAAVAGFGLTLF
jgi:hypothetical protein